MNENDILNSLAPCGLNCMKCFAYEKGEIKYHSNSLKILLGNFKVYSERFVSLLNESRFENYKEFSEMLDLLTEANCTGCRNGECLLKSCGVIKCYKEKNVNFCFECNEFPCKKTNFDEHLERRWIQSNLRMKEIGIKKYYEEIKDIPRYK
jgi:hypothetical protein